MKIAMHFMRILVVILAFSGFLFGQGIDEKAVSRTIPSDQGKLRWTSTARRVAPGSNEWKYECSVKNLENDRTFRVNWEAIPWGWSWLTNGEEMPVCTWTYPGDPAQKDGVIRYWGGKPGEAIENTQIFVPPSPLKLAPLSLNAKAEIRLALGFQSLEKSPRITVFGNSKVSPNKGQSRIVFALSFANARELPSDWRVRWDSIICPEFMKAHEVDSIPIGVLKKGEFTQEIVTERVPTFRLQSIRFLDSTGSTIGQALLPGLAPPALDIKAGE